MCIAADRTAVGGNDIVGGPPFENIAAFLDECLAKGEDEVWDRTPATFCYKRQLTFSHWC
jgi:hypothetical protein